MIAKFSLPDLPLAGPLCNPNTAMQTAGTLVPSALPLTEVLVVADCWRTEPDVEAVLHRAINAAAEIADADVGEAELAVMGFIERLPFKIDGDRVYGPGIYDMKGGAYLAYHAFRQICANGVRSPLGITQIYVSDEEIGSPTSRALIEAEGRKAKYVLVAEPARDGGKIVTGRKGVARFEVFLKGVPAHARA